MFVGKQLRLTVTSALAICASSLALTPNDPYHDIESPGSYYIYDNCMSQWNLYAGDGHDIHARAAWDITTGQDRPVILAMIDSGVLTGHPDLAANIWSNALEQNGSPGVDDDGNGYVDDVFGWDFAGYNYELHDGGDNDPTPAFDPELGYSSSHGTITASIAAAVTNNGVGIAGVAFSAARIMVLKVLDDGGNSTGQAAGDGFQLAEAIRYAADNGARVINMSLALEGESLPGEMQAITDAVQYAYRHDVVMVAASGNSNQPQLAIPAALPEVLAVGATTNWDQRVEPEHLMGLPYGSNYGQGLDLVAPGYYITACSDDYEAEVLDDFWPGFYPEANDVYDDGYTIETFGTSLAAPHVAGAAALILSLRPDLHNSEVMDIIRQSADDLDAVYDPEADVWKYYGPGYDIYTGYGRLNLEQALLLAQSWSGPGDIDGNGVVDGLDLTALIAAYGSQPGEPRWNPAADLDANGIVDGLDLTEVIANFAAAAAVPEPTSTLLLLTGWALCSTRRRMHVAPLAVNDASRPSPPGHGCDRVWSRNNRR